VEIKLATEGRNRPVPTAAGLPGLPGQPGTKGNMTPFLMGVRKGLERSGIDLGDVEVQAPRSCLLAILPMLTCGSRVMHLAQRCGAIRIDWQARIASA
jgi:hypothetical protein